MISATNEARILCRWVDLPLGYHETRYEWEGERTWPVGIHIGEISQLTNTHIRQEKDIPRTLNCFPWPLRFVSYQYDHLGETAYYVRDEPGLWAYWRAREWAWRGAQWLRTRIILTAIIWGVGEAQEGEIIDWRCLKKRKS